MAKTILIRWVIGQGLLVVMKFLDLFNLTWKAVFLPTYILVAVLVYGLIVMLKNWRI